MRNLWTRGPLRLLLVASLLSVFVVLPAAERQTLAQGVPQRPNILFILTDDQEPESIARMANVQRLLVDQGTKFSNAFATTAVCCPSRVSFMRGQYAHNHGVLTNSAPRGGYERFIGQGLQDSTVATWLNDTGYATFYAGKYLNGYGTRSYVPPGWDEWYAFAGVGEQKYVVNENGTLETYTQEQQHDDYYLRDRTEAFIRSQAQGEAPWFAWVSTHAPHSPHTAAPEFRASYDAKEMPRPKSYNEADVSDKPAWIQDLPLVDDDCSTDELYLDCHEQVVEEWRARQEALMGVNVMVGDLINALAESNQLDRTYIVFASDNGYLLYRHRWYAKGAPYEESQGVPFVVRGPGVRRGFTSGKLAANIDLAPTIADWAGAQAPEYVDGRSLRPVLEGTSLSWRKSLLLESWDGRKPYAGIRTAGGETYVEHESGDKEYYDLASDPRQVRSAHAAPENAARLRTFSRTLSGFEDCAGAGCRVADREP